MRKYIILLLIISFNTLAQIPINSSFERINNNFIKRWSLVNSSMYFDLRTDSINKFDGAKSLKLTNKTLSEIEGKTGTFFSLTRIPIDMLKGKKKISISGYMKADTISKDVMLWANTIGTKIQPTYQNTLSQKKVSNIWNKYTIDLPLDSSTRMVNYGGSILGQGSAWFDKIEIMLDNKVVIDSELEEFKDVGNDEIDLIDKSKVNIDLSSPDFTKVVNYFYKNQRIISLGESTHGTSEFFRMKNRIITTLIENKKLNVILAFENSFGSTATINDYILNGKGDPKLLIKRNFFSVWKTKEFLELIEWMKEFNTKNPNKVFIMGFDMQSSNDILQLLANFSDDQELKLSIRDFKVTDSTMVKNPKELEKYLPDLRLKLEAIKNIISKKVLLSNTDSLSKIAFQSLNILTQYIGKFNKNYSNSYRDSCMAQNINWIAQHYKNKNIIVWAHNGHIMKSDKRMGAYLSEMYKDDYLAIGQTTYNGSYTSFNNLGASQNSILTIPFKDSYEYWLNKVNSKDWMIDLQVFNKSRKKNSFFDSVLGFRSIGFKEQQFQFSDTILSKSFDFLVFLKNTSNSQVLK